MAENLNYNASGSKCYDNNESNCKKYGRLYNWSTANSACPSGWHLPSNAEWGTLVDFAGGEKLAGNILKATSGWSNNGNGVDAAGFAALPGDGVGDSGNWWSANEYKANSNEAVLRCMDNYNDGVCTGRSSKNKLYSVRCLQD